MVSRNFIRFLSSMAAVSLIAGCSATDGSNFGLGGKKKVEEDPNKPVIVQGACPFVYLREGTAIYRQYAKGTKKGPDGLGDPDKLVVQATLDQTTRQCRQTDQGLVVTVVVHGRIIPGPVGGPGTYTLPIRVAATDGSATLYSELTKFEVTIPPSQNAATQFIFTKENVVLSGPATGLTRLFAGIDEGPYNTK
ncbi:MAG: hypothetical protein RLZZ444_1788 [Pseudomonadota bacterium]|jgi:hypothetical protein